MGTRDPLRRRARRALAVASVAIVMVLASAAPASAHAVLVSSTPNPAQILDRSPEEIRLDFSEAVEANLGSVRLYDEDARRLDVRDVTTDPDDVVHATIAETLPDGSYVVTWSVISSDSHPVRGAFTFQVGTAADATSPELEDLARRLTDEQSGDRTVGVLLGIARWGVFAGIAALVGALVFVAGVDPAARAARATRRIAWAGWCLCTGASVVGLLLLGPYGAGEGLGDVFDPALLGDVLGSRYGLAWLARVVVLLTAVPLVGWLLRPRASDAGRARQAASALGLGLVLAVTVALAGHATAGDLVAAAFTADVLHVLAMAVWVGGLTTLVVATLATDDVGRLSAVLPRWSRVALGSVVVVIVTGTFQAWRQVGGLDALRETEYGRLLIVKLILVALMLLFAFQARRVVSLLHWWWTSRAEVKHGDPTDDDLEELDERRELRLLRRGVGAEVLLSLLVLVVTALLVNSVPAETAQGLSAEGATGVTLESSAVTVQVDAAPARAGANDIHVYTLAPDGTPLPVEELTLTFELPSLDIAPIDVPLRMLTTFHGYSPGFDIPISGDWQVRAKVRVSEFDATTLEGTITIL